MQGPINVKFILRISFRTVQLIEFRQSVFDGFFPEKKCYTFAAITTEIYNKRGKDSFVILISSYGPSD